MARKAGDRYRCDKCGAELVYEEPCPCPSDDEVHSETCCEQKMTKVEERQAANR